MDKLKHGENYGIPYGVLVPKGWSNLWVAGRCASSDVKVHGAIRDQPACSMMGQAAGTAAVQSIRTGQPAFGNAMVAVAAWVFRSSASVVETMSRSVGPTPLASMVPASAPPGGGVVPSSSSPQAKRSVAEKAKNRLFLRVPMRCAGDSREPWATASSWSMSL